MVKALALEVARELNMSPEKAYAICKSFHDGIRTILRKPEEAKRGLMIHDFLVFTLKERRIERQLEYGDSELKQLILENLKRYKRNDTKKKQTVQEKHNA